MLSLYQARDRISPLNAGAIGIRSAKAWLYQVALTRHREPLGEAIQGRADSL